MMQLSIKRVPTVVSNHQKDEAEETARQSGGCGKNCLRSCCIPGAKLALYAFKKESKFENEKNVLEIENKEPPITFLDCLVLGELKLGIHTLDWVTTYNSLGAFATINHLHFQAYYLAVPFPIEKAPTKKITTLNDGVIISELLQYPVRGLVFEGGNTLQVLSDTLSDACICLQDSNIPYNVLISDCGKRIFLLPQCYAEKQALGEVSSELLDTQVNPAVWEISGHMVLKRRKDYDEASEENAWRLLAEVSLSDERFQEVNALIFEAITGGKYGVENVVKVEEPVTKAQSLGEENAITESSHHAMVAGTQECLVRQ